MEQLDGFGDVERLRSELARIYEYLCAGRVMSAIVTMQTAAARFNGKSALADIGAERRRQIEAEGFNPDHDDDLHGQGDLARAGAAYAQVAAGTPDYKDGLWPTRSSVSGQQYAVAAPECWPWDQKWWKPKDPRRDLVRAGALILAEIERLDRAAAREPAKAE